MTISVLQGNLEAQRREIERLTADRDEWQCQYRRNVIESQAEVQRQQGEIERWKAQAKDNQREFFAEVEERRNGMKRLQAEIDQLRQQLGEAVEVLEVIKAHNSAGSRNPYIEIDANEAIAKLKGDRTDG